MLWKCATVFIYRYWLNLSRCDKFPTTYEGNTSAHLTSSWHAADRLMGCGPYKVLKRQETACCPTFRPLQTISCISKKHTGAQRATQKELVRIVCWLQMLLLFVLHIELYSSPPHPYTSYACTANSSDSIIIVFRTMENITYVKDY